MESLKLLLCRFNKSELSEIFARPIEQGPCDQRPEDCLAWENSFGQKMAAIPIPSKIDNDHF